MPENITFSPGDLWVEVQAVGVVTEQEIFADREAVVRLLKEYDVGAVLVDASTWTEAPPTHVMYEFVQTFQDAGMPREARLAMLTGAQTSVDLRFIETLGVNRGFLFRIFSSRSEAEAWLSKARQD